MKDSLQAQLTATKQQHILAAAAKVFSEKGFHAATIKDVAAAAGVAHGSIYTHFENKEALLIGLFDLMSAQARVEATAVAPPQGDPVLLLRAMLYHPLAALTSGNAELFRVIVSEALVNRAFAERVRAQILEPMVLEAAELLKHTLFLDAPVPPDFDLRVRAMSGLMLGMIVRLLLLDDVLQSHWDDLPDLLADILVHGLKGAPS